jgi:hypothetical protein
MGSCTVGKCIPLLRTDTISVMRSPQALAGHTSPKVHFQPCPEIFVGAIQAAKS